MSGTAVEPTTLDALIAAALAAQDAETEAIRRAQEEKHAQAEREANASARRYAASVIGEDVAAALNVKARIGTEAESYSFAFERGWYAYEVWAVDKSRGGGYSLAVYYAPIHEDSSPLWTRDGTGPGLDPRQWLLASIGQWEREAGEA